MRAVTKAFFSLAAFFAPAALPQAATLGGFDYAIQYDYREFYSVADNKPFQVVIVGNPFPGQPISDVARRMLPVMQAGKPPPNLTFTYDMPAQEPRPYYRVVLVFNATNEFGADAVCRGQHKVTEGQPGRIKLFAVYCRNDQFMSQVLASAVAERPDDPEMQGLYTQLFAELFPRGQGRYPQPGGNQFR